MPETWCYWHFLCMFASSRLIALCTANCKSLWIKASAKWLNVNVNIYIYIYIYACVCLYKYVYSIYIWLYSPQSSGASGNMHTSNSHQGDRNRDRWSVLALPWLLEPHKHQQLQRSPDAGVFRPSNSFRAWDGVLHHRSERTLKELC